MFWLWDESVLIIMVMALCFCFLSFVGELGSKEQEVERTIFECFLKVFESQNCHEFGMNTLCNIFDDLGQMLN